MKITGLNHITINVTDLEQAKAFYEKVLGLEPAGFIDMGDHALTYYQLPQGVRLELIDYEQKDQPVSVPETHVGMYRHLCLEVDSEASLKELEERCAAFGRPVRKSSSWVEKLGCFNILITDPNDVEIEVLSYNK